MKQIMARSFERVTPDRLQIREGGGAMAVFGLPFFAVGVFITLAGLDVVPISHDTELPRFPVLALMGVAFTGVGGVLVFGRNWTTLDIAQRTVVKQLGLIRILQRGAWRSRTVAAIDASDIVDVDYSTRDSAIESAARAAEQRVLASGRSVPAAVGPRTQWMLAAVNRLVKGRGLVIKTRQGLTTFGEGLEDDEIRYLHGVVRAALRG